MAPPAHHGYFKITKDDIDIVTFIEHWTSTDQGRAAIASINNAVIRIPKGRSAGLYLHPSIHTLAVTAMADDLVEAMARVSIYRRAGLCEECRRSAAFGLPTDARPSRCKQHATGDMENIVSLRCGVDGCKTCPSYGLPTDARPSRCKQYATAVMKDIVNPLCGLYGLVAMNRKYKPNCAECHAYLHPDASRIRNMKTKEHAFMVPLQEIFLELVRDRPVADGCSRRRPDSLIDCVTHVLIIEIDEQKHRGYDALCENRRTMELSLDVAHRPLVFIRLNPDAFSRDGVHHKSVFSLTKGGKLKADPDAFEERLSALIRSVKDCLEQIPEKTVGCPRK